MENRSDFSGRVVVDVGAGSGILSMFAALVCINLRYCGPRGLLLLFVCILLSLFLINVHYFLPNLGWCQACVCCGGVRNG